MCGGGILIIYMCMFAQEYACILCTVTSSLLNNTRGKNSNCYTQVGFLPSYNLLLVRRIFSRIQQTCGKSFISHHVKDSI
jgi:hypothetical protein